MNASQQYDQIFMETFGVAADQLEGLAYKGTPQWDSVGQLTLISSLESTFGIMLSPEDLIDLDSYATGRELLRSHYGLDL